MIEDEADLVRVSALAREKFDAEANEMASEEVSAETRSRLEAERSERERVEF